MEAVADETKSLKKVWLALAAVYDLTSINNGISYSYEKIKNTCQHDSGYFIHTTIVLYITLVQTAETPVNQSFVANTLNMSPYSSLKTGYVNTCQRMPCNVRGRHLGCHFAASL